MRALLVILALGFSLPADAQTQERRVALVIGVSDYTAVARLANAAPDAQRIHDTLVATGFTLPAPLLNPTNAELEAALLEFSRRADRADVAVLYFAGHGMQQFDDNWLIPRDARLERSADIRVEGVRLQDIVGFMGGATLRIIILDACRNNPFSARWQGTMSPAVGLTRIDDAAAPEGTVIAYSAGPRQVAPDNGAYARALATRMQEDGVELRQVFERVRRDTAQGANLSPEATIALNTAPFYFRGAPQSANAPQELRFIPPDQAPDARTTPSSVRAPLVRSTDVARLRDFALFRECADCPEMVVIPAGTFLMGSPDSEPNRRSDEGPQHSVSIRRFAVGRFEVTAAEWEACLQQDRSGCSDQVTGRGRNPATNVSWDDAQAYMRWLNAQASAGATMVSTGGAPGAYRLLTEAEWEYAARAGTTTAYSTGASISAEQARFYGRDISSAATVGSYPANAFGLHDMHGNVLEWVEDCYGDYERSAAEPTCSPPNRVLRGGSWSEVPEAGGRSAGRTVGLLPSARSIDNGFRAARTL